MTREEAIKILQGIDRLIGDDFYSDTIEEAVEMAIEALQTPPISQRSMYQAGYRQAQSDAIEAIELVDWYHQNSNKDMVHGANDDEHQAWYKAEDVYKALEAIPSADRPRGEWIDKEELIDAINDAQFVYDGNEGEHKEYDITELVRVIFKDIISNLSSADMRGEDK